jgi:hypothetical protein
MTGRELKLDSTRLGLRQLVVEERGAHEAALQKLEQLLARSPVARRLELNKLNKLLAALSAASHRADGAMRSAQTLPAPSALTARGSAPLAGCPVAFLHLQPPAAAQPRSRALAAAALRRRAASAAGSSQPRQLAAANQVGRQGRTALLQR